jgi:hypothetical protein
MVPAARATEARRAARRTWRGIGALLGVVGAAGAPSGLIGSAVDR